VSRWASLGLSLRTAVDILLRCGASDAWRMVRWLVDKTRKRSAMMRETLLALAEGWVAGGFGGLWYAVEG